MSSGNPILGPTPIGHKATPGVTFFRFLRRYLKSPGSLTDVWFEQFFGISPDQGGDRNRARGNPHCVAAQLAGRARD
jgi:hypothetical protein